MFNYRVSIVNVELCWTIQQEKETSYEAIVEMAVNQLKKLFTESGCTGVSPANLIICSTLGDVMIYPEVEVDDTVNETWVNVVDEWSD